MVSPLDQVSDGGFDARGGGGGGDEGEVGSEDGYEGDGGAERRPNLRALMTMLVVSLRMQRLVHWVVRKRCLDGLSEENLIDLLAALEVMNHGTTNRPTDRPTYRLIDQRCCLCVGLCISAWRWLFWGRGEGGRTRPTKATLLYIFVLFCFGIMLPEANARCPKTHAL